MIKKRAIIKERKIDMKITLKGGTVKEYEGAVSVLDIAKDISEGLARAATSAKVDGETVDLRTELTKDCELEILTFDSEGGKGAFNHTASHIMAQAVKRLEWEVYGGCEGTVWIP